MPFRELLEVRSTGHQAVGVHDLADDGGGRSPGHARQVEGGLGLARAHEHAAGVVAQREDVAGAGEVGRPGCRIDEYLDGAGAVGRGDARRDALGRVRRDGEGRTVPCGIGLHHLRQSECVQPVAFHRHADQAAGVHRHEVDGLLRDEVRREGEVALVLAVFIVNDDYEAPVAKRFDGLFGRQGWHACFRSLVNGLLLTNVVRGDVRDDELFDVLGGDIGLQVQSGADPAFAEGGVVPRERYDRDRKGSCVPVHDGHAHAVEGHEALLDHVAHYTFGGLEPDDAGVAVGDDRLDCDHAVDVPLDHVAADALAPREGAFQVDAVARLELAQVRPVKRFGDDLDRESLLIAFDDGETGSGESDAVRYLQVFQHLAGRDDDAGAVE